MHHDNSIWLHGQMAIRNDASHAEGSPEILFEHPVCQARWAEMYVCWKRLENSCRNVTKCNHHQSNHYCCRRFAELTGCPATRSRVIHGGTSSASWRRRRKWGVRKITAVHQGVNLHSFYANLKDNKEDERLLVRISVYQDSYCLKSPMPTECKNK